MIRYNTSIINYNQDGAIFRDAATIGYIFANTGNQILYINNLQLLPGSCWKTLENGMIDVSLYRVRFEQNPTYPSCANQYSNLQVIIYSLA
jgi:hypothetical protein